ncbi:UTRA domain-containing protein [Streptomyces sp. SL13]|uniref:UTRA domain-containing protein n=1 Tax=Streptantibioticus silvisoli TaxID=2705255 RepID=A0AA90JW61_9ACTN|nr:UTRA domain-containing protein [Streptantibioticus silvisoli]MDI5968621.1 UTRA domain-containing protein [Streptantibioticus silvisoli]
MASSEWVHTSAPYLKPRAAGQADAWTEETAAKGRRGTQRILSAEEVPAPEGIAQLLGLNVGEPVVVRRRVIMLDEAVTELTDTYFPAALARGTRLAGTAKIPGGAVTLLAELGHTADTVREEVAARMPDDAEREALALGEGQPVLTLTRVILNSAGEPFQVDATVFPATTQRLRYETKVV